ncbi:hypothetical protein, partial [Lysinibacillus sphaericus]|uniref:hypothetical protein n=1 Tax=Lysinibacillus sphaericus TaxID=1421 RepID=UPI0019D61261
ELSLVDPIDPKEKREDYYHILPNGESSLDISLSLLSLIENYTSNKHQDYIGSARIYTQQVDEHIPVL